MESNGSKQAIESNGSKTPTWQWVAVSAISLLLVFASLMMNETRSDIREVWTQMTGMSTTLTPRIAALEASQTAQYVATNERQADIKIMLGQIISEQKVFAENLAKLDKRVGKGRE